jgi:hypothetical protein
MELEALCRSIDEYCLLVEASREYGPYSSGHDGRRHYVIVEDDGSRRTVSEQKYILEKHLGRKLHPDNETVDHIDFNKDNNSLENLRIVPRKEHSADDTRRVKLVDFNCSLCGKHFQRSPRLVRDKSKKGVSGIFCSRECAGKYSRQLQLGLIDKLPVQPYIESEYYRRKNVQAFVERMTIKYIGSQINDSVEVQRSI